MSANSLRELYVEELRDLYNAETQLVKALPKMAKAATNADLKAGFEEHLEVTQGQVERLERIFAEMDEKPKGKKCVAMEGLVQEGKEIIDELDKGEVLDAALVGAAQKVEHYEIAGYGTVRTWAEMLGFEDAARLLQETLDEEKATDLKLTELAESVINVEAEEAGEEEEEEVAMAGSGRNGRSKR